MSEEVVREMTMEEMVKKNKTYLGFIEDRYKEMQKRCEKLNDRCEDIELNSYNVGFKKGKELMQEKVNKLCEFYWDTIDVDILRAVFGNSTWAEILENVEEACNKILEYEEKERYEKEIHVGDIVENISSGEKLFVTTIEKPYVYTLDKDGKNGIINQDDVMKTGKHYGLDEILKELK